MSPAIAGCNIAMNTHASGVYIAYHLDFSVFSFSHGLDYSLEHPGIVLSIIKIIAIATCVGLATKIYYVGCMERRLNQPCIEIFSTPLYPAYRSS